MRDKERRIVPGKYSAELEAFYGNSHAYLDSLKRHQRPHFSFYCRLCRLIVAPGSSLLDIGCGTGLSSLMLAEDGFQVTGADISPLFIGEAMLLGREHGNLAFAQEDAIHLSFPDLSFDAVCSYDMVEHVPDVEAALGEMCRVARNHVVVVSGNRLHYFAHLRTMVRGARNPRPRPWEAHSRLKGFFKLVHSSLLASVKAVGLNSRKYQCKPHLSPDKEACGVDYDITWLSNPFDIARIIRENGFLIRPVFIRGDNPLLGEEGGWAWGRIGLFLNRFLHERCAVVGTRA